MAKPDPHLSPAQLDGHVNYPACPSCSGRQNLLFWTFTVIILHRANYSRGGTGI